MAIDLTKYKAATSTLDLSKYKVADPAPQPTGLLDRITSGVNESAQRRAQIANETADAYASGKQGAFRSLFQIGGQVVGAALDPFVEGAKAVTPEPVKKGLTTLLKPLSAGINLAADKISDSPAVQKFALSDQGRALDRDTQAIQEYLNLLPGPKGTALAARGTQLAADTAKTGITTATNAARNTAIDSLERNIRLAAEGTITPKKFLAKSEARNKDPVRFLAERNIEPVVRDGKMQTGEQADKLNVSAQPLNQHLDMALAEVEQGVAKTPLEALRTKALSSAADLKNVTETVRKQIENAINQEFDLLKEKGPADLTLREVNSIKKTQWRATKFDSTKPYQSDAQYLMGRAAKETIEDTVPKDAFSVHELNSHIGDIYDAEKFLRTLDGRAVKGGRLGKYFGRTLGAMVGTSVAGGHPIGTFLGTLGGDGVIEILQRNTFSNPLKRMILANIQKTNPAAYQQVLDYIKKAGLERETRPLLPSPRYTPMGPKTPPQSNVRSAPAAEGPNGTFLSTPKEN